MSGWWFNCFSYAVGYYDDWLEPYDNGYPYSYPANQYYYETVYIPYAMSTMGAYNIAVRIIVTYYLQFILMKEELHIGLVILIQDISQISTL